MSMVVSGKHGNRRDSVWEGSAGARDLGACDESQKGMMHEKPVFEFYFVFWSDRQTER